MAFIDTVSRRGQPVAVLFYDFHRLRTAAVGGRRAVTGPPSSSAMACVIREGIGKTQMLLFPGKHLRLILEKVLARAGLGRSPEPSCCGASWKLLCYLHFQWFLPPGVVWTFVGAVVYMTPCWAE